MDERMRRNRSRRQEERPTGQMGSEQRARKVMRRRKKRKRRNHFKFPIAISVAAVIIYTVIALKYRNIFLPNTVIGGIPVSGMTVDGVKAEIDTTLSEYKLTIEERDGEETIWGKDIGLHPVYDAGALEQIAEKEALKPYTDVVVTYKFGSHSEILDGNTTLQWLSYDEEGDVTIDRGKVEEYVQELAGKYNTAYCAKELKTSYGPTVTITKGSYGWMIDKKSEAAALMEILKAGESVEREPIYLQKAASHESPDYGNTYVEINLTAQHMFFYKGGKLLVQSDFVSGNESKGWSTPAGAFGVTYKQRNAVLRGKNYNTPVTYWIPFKGNIGMHDGYWRTSFGGSIYKKNGSHGCVNLPPAVAKTVYENIEAGLPVLCYHLEGTETSKTTSIPSGKTSSSTANKTVEKQPEAPSAPETTPASETSGIPDPTPALNPSPVSETSLGSEAVNPSEPAAVSETSPAVGTSPASEITPASEKTPLAPSEGGTGGPGSLPQPEPTGEAEPGTALN